MSAYEYEKLSSDEEPSARSIVPVGSSVGAYDGKTDGADVVGRADVGRYVGADVGTDVGTGVGTGVGRYVGKDVGARLGGVDGSGLGGVVGVCVGAGVGANVSTVTDVAAALAIESARCGAASAVVAAASASGPAATGESASTAPPGAAASARRRLPDAADWMFVVSAPLEIASTSTLATCDCTDSLEPSPYALAITASGIVSSEVTETAAPSSPLASAQSASPKVALRTVASIARS